MLAYDTCFLLLAARAVAAIWSCLQLIVQRSNTAQTAVVSLIHLLHELEMLH
jgi:hypothetical protein